MKKVGFMLTSDTKLLCMGFQMVQEMQKYNIVSSRYGQLNIMHLLYTHSVI